MKKFIFIVISIIVGILVYYKSDEIIIPSDAIRIRIIANSNNIKDLYQKKKLKEEIKNDLYNLIKESNSSEEVSRIITDNLDNIKEMINSKTDDVTVNYGINHFPKKIYKGIVYPEGDYESLVITLGNGLGENWWCVLYPPLCMIDDNNITKDVEYKLLVSEMLNY